MKEDHLESYYEEETYTKGLSREDTIERQVRICAYNYSRGFFLEFEYSVHMLIALLPKDIRDTFPSLSIDISTQSAIHNHYTQFIDIQRALEEDTNMVFKKKFIKTYE